jgi:predicted permease
MRRFLVRLLTLFQRDKAERELAREIAAHVAMLEDELRRRGVGADDAHRQARLAIGGIEQTKELQRDARSFVWIEDLATDLAHAARVLRREPMFALTAALSLALGIGANTAIFTLANALLFRNPVGVVDAARVVDIGTSRPDGGFNPTSYPKYLAIRAQATTLADVYARPMFPHAMSFAADGGADSVFAQFVTPNYFAVLGTAPAIGRMFGARGEEDEPLVVLGHGFWRRRFGADPHVLGRTMRLNGQPFVICGVAPEGFQGTGVTSADLWLPLDFVATGSAREALFAGRGGWLIVGGRLKPAIPLEQAASEIDALGRALTAQDAPSTTEQRLRLVPSSRVPGNNSVIGAFVALLTIIVSLVLAVACANVAGILLARATTRRREIAVRLALGAGRWRLVRQLLTETIALFVLGGALGVALARIMITAIVSLLPSLPFPISVALPIDGRVIGFTAVLSFATAIAAGLAPALHASKTDVLPVLKDIVQTSPRRSRLRRAFVVAQVALSLVLVVCAGLFVRALQQAGSTDPGFDSRNVELVSLDLSMADYTDAAAGRFWSDLLQRVRQVSTVEAATVARVLPGGFEGLGMRAVDAPGLPPLPQDFPLAWNVVEAGYFATLRIPLLVGRDFMDTDAPGAPDVAVISESLARHFWPGQNPIGRSLSYYPNGPQAKPLLVVGVARDVKSSRLIDGVAGSFIYLPLQQHHQSAMTIVVRGRGDRSMVDDLRSIVSSMDRNLPIVSSQTLAGSTELGFAPQRVAASMSGILGLVGLLLAAVGIHGVTAQSVADRRRELGIRLALGAEPVDVVRMILVEGMLLATIGLTIGLVIAAQLGKLLSGFLFGVSPLDPRTFIGAVVLFLSTALVACYVPVRRATLVDPADTLRYE